MVAINTNIITLNINGLNILYKKRDKMQNSILYRLQETL